MKFEIDLTKLPDLDKVIEKIKLPEILNQEMLNTRARIIQDTVAGKTADGGGLKPYSRSYIEEIDSGYVPGKAPGNHTPNLTATGQLLRSFVIEAKDLVVTMFFQGTHSRPGRTDHASAKRKRKRAEKGGATLQHKGNRPAKTSAIGAAKPQGGGKVVKGKRASRGGGDTQNAVIAKGQYEMGRSGWMAFSRQDIDRINKRVVDALQKVFAAIKK